ncbi:MAG: Na(+)-translocating NADH-quinone reductase subunit A [Cyclobacteriaceae bacterium]|nr:Na(+)-translocating NADH-quinone reductase subunit A [Cyclobacteriaceae bacterium]
MSQTIKIKKGYNLNLAGKADKKVVDVGQPELFAIKPTDFLGINRPKLLVSEGDNVKAGTPLFFDRQTEEVLYTSPVSGEIVEIVRGDKRKILEIRILADKDIVSESFVKYSTSDIQQLETAKAKEILLKSGCWVNIIQRPYGIVADPEEAPKSIFISGFDTHPLAPSYDVLHQGEEPYLQAGIDVLKKFTSGKVHLSLNASEEIPKIFSKVSNVEIHKFNGPHPAGNVGTQIHFIDPINKGDVVWTIQPFGLIQIGKLFLDGKYDASKIIALAGSEVANPQYYKTYIGASVKKFLQDNLKQDHVRIVTGNVLTGERIKSDGFIGYYHNMVTVLPEGDQQKFLGWLLPPVGRPSLHRVASIWSFLNGSKPYAPNTNLNGEPRAFVQSGAFEKVVPIDILPTHLIKAIMAEDYDEMEALGIYEVIEEDLALCEFMDVSKHDVQAIIRQGLDLLKNS